MHNTRMLDVIPLEDGATSKPPGRRSPRRAKPVDPERARAVARLLDDDDAVLALPLVRLFCHPASPFGLFTHPLMPASRRVLAVLRDRTAIVPSSLKPDSRIPVVRAGRSRFPDAAGRWVRTVVGGHEVWLGRKALDEIAAADAPLASSGSAFPALPSDGAIGSWLLLGHAVFAFALGWSDAAAPGRRFTGVSFLLAASAMLAGSVACAFPGVVREHRRQLAGMGLFASLAVSAYLAYVSWHFLQFRAGMWAAWFAASALFGLRAFPTCEPPDDSASTPPTSKKHRATMGATSLAWVSLVVAPVTSFVSFGNSLHREERGPVVNLGGELRVGSPSGPTGDVAVQAVIKVKNVANDPATVLASVYRVKVVAADGRVLGLLRGDRLFKPGMTLGPAEESNPAPSMFVPGALLRQGPVRVVLEAEIITGDGNRLGETLQLPPKPLNDGTSVRREAVTPRGLLERLTRGGHHVVVRELGGSVEGQVQDVSACMARAEDRAQLCDDPASSKQLDDFFRIRSAEPLAVEAVIGG